MDTSEFDNQLIDVIAGWIMWLHIGSVHAYTIGLRDFPEPTATEWGMLRDELEAGVHLSEALDNLLERVPSDGLKLIVDAFHANLTEGGGSLDLSDRLDEVLDMLWDRYSPETKPAATNRSAIRELYRQLRSDNGTEHAQARDALLAMRDHAVIYLDSGLMFGAIYSTTSVAAINMLKVIGTESAVKHLVRYAQVPYRSEDPNRAVARAVLDELGIHYETSQAEVHQCAVCKRTSTEISGRHCWVCHEFVCEDHLVLTDLNKQAVFCSQEHLERLTMILTHWS